VRRSAVAASLFVVLGCVLEPSSEIEDEDDGAHWDETRDATHRAALRACEREPDDDLLQCVRTANDDLAHVLVRETGSEAVVMPPMSVHRELGADVCSWLAETTGRESRRCETELEVVLGEMMDVWLEGGIASPAQLAMFYPCHALHDEALAHATNELEVTLAAATFAACVERTIGDAAEDVVDSPSPIRADARALELLTVDAPDVADQICILLTVRDGEHLLTHRVLQCQAEWQIELFAVVQSPG
jgi:hypothetical protein